MTYLRIQYELKTRGLTEAEIAREFGCSPQHVGAVIRRRSTSAALENLIAEKLGVAVEGVFPDRGREVAV